MEVLSFSRDIVDVFYGPRRLGHPGHSLGESYASAETQSVYSTASADWASKESESNLNICFLLFHHEYFLYFFRFSCRVLLPVL